MILLTLKPEECPYCNMDIEIKPDIDKKIFNWHLSGHNQINEWYGLNNEIRDLIDAYAHDYRSDRYDEKTMAMMLKDFFKKANELK